MAIRVFNALVDGTGGLNWSGLELIAEFYGLADIEGLIERLLIVKAHRPPEK